MVVKSNAVVAGVCAPFQTVITSGTAAAIDAKTNRAEPMWKRRAASVIAKAATRPTTGPRLGCDANTVRARTLPTKNQVIRNIRTDATTSNPRAGRNRRSRPRMPHSTSHVTTRPPTRSTIQAIGDTP